jgi:hypothetical protein
MDIKGLPHLDEIQGIVFCAVLEPFREGPENNVPDLAQLRMRHKGTVDICRSRFFNYMKSKNVWHEYFVQESFELKGDSLQAELFIPSPLFVRYLCMCTHKNLGGHLKSCIV